MPFLPPLQTDFNFVRQLIEETASPDDVTIQVLTQARGGSRSSHCFGVPARRKTGDRVHLYNATARCSRRLVFGMDKGAIVELATLHPALFVSCVKNPETHWRYEYSPETFSLLPRPEFALEFVKGRGGRSGSRATGVRWCISLPPPPFRSQYAERLCRPDRVLLSATSAAPPTCLHQRCIRITTTRHRRRCCAGAGPSWPEADRRRGLSVR